MVGRAGGKAGPARGGDPELVGASWHSGGDGGPRTSMSVVITSRCLCFNVRHMVILSMRDVYGCDRQR